jgi:hypothetical protein
MRTLHHPCPLRPVAAAVAAIIGATQTPAWSYPLDDEFLVNTTTDNHQQLPDVAMDSDGNFVVVFQNHLPVTNANVSAQRYNAAGGPEGSEFLVNTTQSSGNTFPAVAMDDDGDFVVVWEDFGDDGSGYGIFGQRYNAAGAPQGNNFLVNTTTANSQSRPDVAMDADGDFVVVWEDNQFGDSSRAVKAQRYTSAGVAVGGQMDISTGDNVDQVWPQVAMDDAGNFVVAWAAGNVGANQDVVFRLFESDGDPVTNPLQVNVTTKMDHASGVLNNVTVGMDATGDFAIAWRADNFTGPGVPGAAIGILARLYDSNGNAKNDAFLVDDESAATLGKPEIAMNGDGDFIVAYEGPDGSLSGARIQRYYANGDPKGASFVANTSTSLVQGRPAIAIDADGDGVVTWETGGNLDGDGDATFARRLFGGANAPTSDFNHDFYGDIGFRNTQNGRNVLWLMNGFSQRTHQHLGRLSNQAWQVAAVGDFDRDGHADYLWRNGVSGRNVIWFMDEFGVASSANIPSASSGWNVVGTGDFNRDGMADIVWRNSNDARVFGWLMNGPLRVQSGLIGTPSLDWQIRGLADLNGDGRTDLLFRHGLSGRNVIWFMNGFDRSSSELPAANTNWKIESVGDFNRDGSADILWRNAVGGRNVIWELEDGVQTASHSFRTVADTNWQVLASRDFDRDGDADVLWRHALTGGVVIWWVDEFLRASTSSLGDVALSWTVVGQN